MFHTTLPEGLVIKPGRCIIATKDFPANYTFICHFVQSPIFHKEFTLVVNGTPLTCQGARHTRYYNKTWWYFGWDTFINHSCDPNCTWKYPLKAKTLQTGTNQIGTYTITTLSPIHAGDEITTCYNLEDYGEEGEGYFQCTCKSSQCIGIIQEYVREGQLVVPYSGSKDLSCEFILQNQWVKPLLL